MENMVKKLERMESSAVRASDKGFCSEVLGTAAGPNPVNCCGAAKGQVGKAEFAEAPNGASNGGQPQSA
jgi:hypothetical protein